MGSWGEFVLCFKFDLSDYVQCSLSTQELFCHLKYRFLIILPLSAESRSPSRYLSSLCAHSCPAALQSHFCLSYGPQECIPATLLSFKSSFPSNSKLASLAQRWKQFRGVTANISHNLGELLIHLVILIGKYISFMVLERSFPILTLSLSQSVHLTVLFLQDINWTKKVPDCILGEIFSSLGQ